MRAALPLLLVACASPRPDGPAPAAPPAVPDALRAAAAGILDGFDAIEEDPAWRVGDRALYAVSLRTAEGERDWLVSLAVAAMLPEHVAFAVEAYDATGTRLGSSTSTVERDSLGGMFTAAELGARRKVEVDAGEVLPDGGGAVFDLVESTLLRDAAYASLVLFFAVQNDETLAEILWEVVEPPSFLAVIANLWVSLSISFDFLSADASELAIAGWPWPTDTYRVPVTLTLNGDPTLLVTLEVGRLLAPAHVGAGILAFEGRHPTDPWRRVRMELLAARRGPDLAAPAPDAPPR